jgi:hypothetical protein
MGAPGVASAHFEYAVHTWAKFGANPCRLRLSRELVVPERLA